MTRDADKHGRIARAGLFALLWFTAAYYFLGDLGKWMDDWSVHARDAVSGRTHWDKLLALDPLHAGFWRPLHIHAAIALQTAFWRHDWATHLVLAAVHGINAWMLWRVLGRLCTSKQAPALGALFFLVYPGGHEAIYWNSTIGTTVGVWWLLACVLAVQRHAAGEIGWRGLLLRAPLLLTLGWWYEQAAACAPVIAAVYLACAPSTIPLRTRLVRAAALAAAAFLAGLAYALLLIATINPAARGGSQSLIHARDFLPQMRLIASQAWDHLTLSEFVRGALAEGWRAIRSRRWESLVVAAGLVGAFVAFGSWWMRARGNRTEVDGSPTGRDIAARRAWGVAMGAGIVAASMVPAVAVRDQWIAPRLVYTPALGLFIVFAIGADALLGSAWAQRASWPGRAVRGVSLAGLIAGTLLGAAMLIGVQSVWHTRAALDRRIASDLRRVVPSPPPGAVFAPVQVRVRPVYTGSHSFDLIGSGPLEFHWSAPAYMRYVYKRSDVFSLAFQSWLPPSRWLKGAAGAVDSGVLVEAGTLSDAGLPPGPSGTHLIPWDRFVPIRLLKPGRVAVVDTVRIENESDPARDRTIELPRVAVESSDHWTAVIAGLPGAEPIHPDWRLVGADGRSPTDRDLAVPVSAARCRYTAYWMHPVVGAIADRSELRATLKPSGEPRTLAMRAALVDYTRGLSDGVTISVELHAGDATSVLVTETVTHVRLDKE
ncbi:MAG TPA: hypothetical protein VHC70_07710, partial [Phycisphaerales bacterium]|nr:hypothetical protein [Phycisphaerales bacterium]